MATDRHPDMLYRDLGSTGDRVSAIGLGVTVPPIAVASVALMAALWAGSRAFNKLSWWVLPLGWAILVCSSALGVYSVWRWLRGGATWKGRQLK